MIEYYHPSLQQYIQKNGIEGHTLEGHIGNIPRQQERLRELVKNAHNILEIGFNCGHSSDLFLRSSNANIVSFDLGTHHYLITGKNFIDTFYPNRHVLIIGNSVQTIPSYMKQHPDKKFDIIFIDGGHDYEIAKSDLENCKRFAHKSTIVIMDDVVSDRDLYWNVGPKKAWREAEEKSKIITLGREDYSRGRGMIWGKYDRKN